MTFKVFLLFHLGYNATNVNVKSYLLVVIDYHYCQCYATSNYSIRYLVCTMCRKRSAQGIAYFSQEHDILLKHSPTGSNRQAGHSKKRIDFSFNKSLKLCYVHLCPGLLFKYKTRNFVTKPCPKTK